MYMQPVDISLIQKKLNKIPIEVRVKLQQWVVFVESKGLLEAKRFPGFRDHALKGDRKGQRSVYLTKQWRLIYSLDKSNNINIVIVEEITPHDY